MDDTEIIKKIVAEDGHCGSWAKPSVCKACPLSKLVTRSDGTYLNCVEAVGAANMTEEEADARYKQVAEQILLERTIEDFIRDDDGSK